MFELIIVWNITGEKEIFNYNTLEEAKIIQNGYMAAFGSQVWTAINKN